METLRDRIKKAVIEALKDFKAYHSVNLEKAEKTSVESLLSSAIRLSAKGYESHILLSIVLKLLTLDNKSSPPVEDGQGISPKEFIGKGFTAERFDGGIRDIGYCDRMRDIEGREGIVIDYRELNNMYLVTFGDSSFFYPAEVVEKQLLKL